MVLSFAQVEIIEHPVIFDSSYDYKTKRDGMFCGKGGPLLQLSWKSQQRTTVDIDMYEVTRNRRRHGSELRLSSGQRIRMLHSSSASRMTMPRRSKSEPNCCSSSSSYKKTTKPHDMKNCRWSASSEKSSTLMITPPSRPSSRRNTKTARCA